MVAKNVMKKPSVDLKLRSENVRQDPVKVRDLVNF